MLQFKLNERQRRDVHEREYWKFITNLRQHLSYSNRFYLSNEYVKEMERSKTRTFLQRQQQYERIQRENDLLTKRLNQVRGHIMTKEECDKNWQYHVNVMKKTCSYPENIDRFVSNSQRNK